ncbi:MAG: exodeoxyribonuclease [Gammaproteobacteria bacterium]|jgi:exodeoxyribonuclease-1|nr:exodeoxyribonuclease [Gammaproteobacteria bacterium]
MKTLLFYDIESTGLSKCFDQVLQFAAIRTDLELNEIERHEILVKLNPDVIPSAYATITHHVSIADTQQGISELEAMKKIHSLLNAPGTISLGYNTLTFDDEFLRFSFYRNLFNPYSHQFANECRRMDLYPMAIMYHLFKPEVLNWPQLNGQVSLKLDQLSPANNLAQGPAHTAIVDVEATVELARRFKQDEKMWSYLCGYFDKATDQSREKKLLPAWQSSNAPLLGLMFYGKFGTQSYYHAPVLALGQHQHYRNQNLWLRLDRPELVQITENSIKEHSWVLDKKYGEPGFILPMQEPYSQYLSQDRKDIVEQNLAFLQSRPDILDKIMTYHRNYTHPVHPETDIDAALYQNGFLTDADTKLCQRFHALDKVEKIKLLPNLSPRIQEMAIRALGRHCYQDLPEAYQKQFDAHLSKIFSHDESLILSDYTQKKRYSLAQLLADIHALRQRTDLSSKQLALLDELQAYALEKNPS